MRLARKIPERSAKEWDLDRDVMWTCGATEAPRILVFKDASWYFNGKPKGQEMGKADGKAVDQ
jgi:hypothetical protein